MRLRRRLFAEVDVALGALVISAVRFFALLDLFEDDVVRPGLRTVAVRRGARLYRHVERVGADLVLRRDCDVAVATPELAVDAIMV